MEIGRIIKGKRRFGSRDDIFVGYVYDRYNGGHTVQEPKIAMATSCGATSYLSPEDVTEWEYLDNPIKGRFYYKLSGYRMPDTVIGNDFLLPVGTLFRHGDYTFRVESHGAIDETNAVSLKDIHFVYCDQDKPKEEQENDI